MPRSSRFAVPAPRLRALSFLPAIALLPVLLAACAAAPPRAAPAPAIAVEVPDIRHPDDETPQWWYRSGAARAAANGAMADRKSVV